VTAPAAGRPLPVLVNVARPIGEVDPVRLAGEALAAGLSGLGFADSPRIFPDPVVETVRVLASDDRALAGPCVLSLPLLHVSKAASALMTLGGHFPGRVVAVVGRGESSLVNEGLRPPRLNEYAAALAALRARLEDHLATMHLLGAASGPRTIAMTARELGGVLVDVGTASGAVEAAVRHARTADPAATVWAFLRVSVADSPAEASLASASLLGSCASRMAAAPDWYGVTPALAPALSALAAAHDYRRHGTVGARRAPDEESADRAALEDAADAVRDRFILAGSAEALASRFRDLAATGIAGVVLAGGLPGVADRLADLGAASAHLTAPPALPGHMALKESSP
jgi:alkanesulfonate monooxygenase SsuD/methylene tetrahydromethanopterin reductase-like flavin-dependent oxidoreductase (luciferase family)